MRVSVIGHVEWMKILLDRGAQTNAQDKVRGSSMSVANLCTCDTCGL